MDAARISSKRATASYVKTRYAGFFLSTEHRIHLSIASVWEIAIKTSIGRLKMRLKMPEPLDGFLKEQIEGAFLESM